jgi:transcriptional regulator with XRE-family HTH domain
MGSESPLDLPLSQRRTRGEARRALLRARGVTLAALARELGCHLSTVSRVNAGKKRSAVVEAAIARRLGLTIDDAFPEWGVARVRRGRESDPPPSRSARR